MAKRFFYLSMGLLALSLAYHLGAARTEAQGRSGTGPIAFVSAAWPEYIWDQSGECWRREGAEGTEYNLGNQDLFNLPFPAASVVEHLAHDVGEVFVTDDGLVWRFHKDLHGDWWKVLGTFGGPVGVEDQSFGSVKSLFRR